VVFAVIRLLWYPGAYFAIFGIGRLLLVLAVVSLIVGPALSAFVYKPGKKSLAMDLSLLAVVEIIVIVLAVSVIYARQPFYTVFAVDRFEAVSRQEIDARQISHAALLTRPGHEPRLVFAELPQDPEVFSKLIDETVFEGKGDIDRRPEFWKPYAAGVSVVKEAAKPLENLLKGDDHRAARVLRWLAQQQGGRQDFLYLPLRGKTGDALIILHADIGYPVDILNVDPW
jgi:hypothetical protein